MRRPLILLVLLVMLVPAALAQAQEEREPPEGAMLIILDASGSMNNVDQDGIPFIDKAKDAVLELIDALPDGTQVGLRVYGHREPNTDAVRGCQDTELIAPVAPLDRDAIRTAVEGLEASGFTPIGLSLTEAAADLPDDGPRSIVLISDGEDTCAPPDPCQIADDLYGEAFDVRIESVGFLVGTGSAAEQQLRCIAETTGGGYNTVDDANQLVARLGEVTEEILGWRPPMTLNGALAELDAPPIPVEVHPDWVSEEPGVMGRADIGSIILRGDIRWWQLDLWHAEDVWVWADLEVPEGERAVGMFEAIILDSEGKRVEGSVGHGGYAVRAELPMDYSPMIGAGLQDSQGYRPEGRYLVGLAWHGTPEVFLGSIYMSVEVLADPAEYLTRTELQGALDPADAPVLELAGLEENWPGWKGNSYRAPLASGETRWYRLEMERGDLMNVFAVFPGDRFVGEGTTGRFTIHLTDADGSPVGAAFEEWPQLSQEFGTDRHQATVSGTTSLDPDPLPETVLVGFEWEGPAGQQSEIRFEVETDHDPSRAEAADQIEAERERLAQEEQEEHEQTDWSTTTSRAPTTTATAPATATTTQAVALDGAGDDDGGSFPLPVAILIGVVALVGIVTPLIIRRIRA